jgi:hypothetical protein
LGRTVEELLDSLSASELAEWSAFYSLEPWGADAAFLRSGIIASLIANVNRDTKKKAEPFTPQDFMPQFGKAQKKADPLDPKLVKAKFLAAFGGFDGRNKVRDPGREGARGNAERPRPQDRYPAGTQGRARGRAPHSEGGQAASPTKDGPTPKVDHGSKPEGD